METRIESEAERWKDYNSRHRKYIIWRSCLYEKSPSDDNPLPRLSVRIFVHELSELSPGVELKKGEILIYVDRQKWNEIANLTNESEADNQLQKAANSAKERSWEIEPLTRMLNQGCEEIQRKIHEYEHDESIISGEFVLTR
jgi:hypothetical protein